MAIYRVYSGKNFKRVVNNDLYRKDKVIWYRCYGCHYETILTEFHVNELLGNRRGTRAYGHHVISLEPGAPITIEQFVKCVEEFISSEILFRDRIVFLAIHTNRPHLHAHIVFSATSFGGKKYQMSNADLNRLKEHLMIIFTIRGYYYL